MPQFGALLATWAALLVASMTRGVSLCGMEAMQWMCVRPTLGIGLTRGRE